MSIITNPKWQTKDGLDEDWERVAREAHSYDPSEEDWEPHYNELVGKLDEFVDYYPDEVKDLIREMEEKIDEYNDQQTAEFTTISKPAVDPTVAMHNFHKELAWDALDVYQRGSALELQDFLEAHAKQMKLVLKGSQVPDWKTNPAWFVHQYGFQVGAMARDNRLYNICKQWLGRKKD